MKLFNAIYEIEKLTFSLKVTTLCFVIGILLSLVSCKSEEPVPDCKKSSYGTLSITNVSDNPYKLYIDDVFQVQIGGKTTLSNIKVKQGNNHKIYVIQQSGYVLYPTEQTSYLNVISCSDYTKQIP